MINSIEEIIDDAKMGRPFIIVDDEDRENEGDIIVPAEFITADIINFMMTSARGLICVAIDQSTADKFQLKLHPRRNVEESETAFAYSIDAKIGCSTGMSASDKVQTISMLTKDSSSVDDFKVPGHIFPVVAKKMGVLERGGHTEAAVDIAKLANIKPIMVICELVNDDGNMSRRDDIKKFAEKNNLKISSVENLVSFIKRKKSAD
jgi:3,4-dihydroxy-2-butanone 4-phosphate synthase